MRIIAAAIVSMRASSAAASDVDWKLYGGVSVAGPTFCFYDANSVGRTSSGYIRVWTKCLTQKALDGVDSKSDLNTKIVHNAARKIIEGYVPPIIVIGESEFKEIAGIVGYEETANLGALDPQARIFYELNCSERMMRRLSTSIHANGRSDFQDEPSKWEFVPPEGNATTLLKILCHKQ